MRCLKEKNCLKKVYVCRRRNVLRQRLSLKHIIWRIFSFRIRPLSILYSFVPSE
jgi:hypothetical protein